MRSSERKRGRSGRGQRGSVRRAMERLAEADDKSHRPSHDDVPLEQVILLGLDLQVLKVRCSIDILELLRWDERAASGGEVSRVGARSRPLRRALLLRRDGRTFWTRRTLVDAMVSDRYMRKGRQEEGRPGGKERSSGGREARTKGAGRPGSALCLRPPTIFQLAPQYLQLGEGWHL